MLRLILVAVLFSLPLSVFAQSEIDRVEVEVEKRGQFEDLRDQWDQTGRFCATLDGEAQENCYGLTDLGEIQLRHEGEWSQDPIDQTYIARLSEEEIQRLEGYDTYYVRYFGLSDGGEEVAGRPFAVHVFFSFGPGTQTSYLFGLVGRSAEGYKVEFTHYADSQSIEGTLRELIYQAQSVLLGEFDREAARAEMKAADIRRMGPAKSVLETYLNENDVTLSQP